MPCRNHSQICLHKRPLHRMRGVEAAEAAHCTPTPFYRPPSLCFDISLSLLLSHGSVFPSFLPLGRLRSFAMLATSEHVSTKCDSTLKKYEKEQLMDAPSTYLDQRPLSTLRAYFGINTFTGTQQSARSFSRSPVSSCFIFYSLSLSLPSSPLSACLCELLSPLHL